MTATEEKKMLRDIHIIAQSLRTIAAVAKGYEVVDIPEGNKGEADADKDEWI